MRLHEREPKRPHVGEEHVPTQLEGGRVWEGGLLDRGAEVAHRAEVVVGHERERPLVGEERVLALPDGVHLCGLPGNFRAPSRIEIIQARLY